MDAAKFKKLEEYASTLGKKGAEEEKNHEFVEAIQTYLKLVDVLARNGGCHSKLSILGKVHNQCRNLSKENQDTDSSSRPRARKGSDSNSIIC